MTKLELDELVNKLKQGEIGLITEKSDYLKELEKAYLKTRENDSIKFKDLDKLEQEKG